MLHDAPISTRLAGCYVISLRPVGGHGAMRRAVARHGGRVLAVSPWRLRQRDDERTRAALHDALLASRVVVTSPAAARAARHLAKLAEQPGQAWLAVGAGTARALRRAGVGRVASPPARMDSDGLLQFDALHDVEGVDVGLLTAPGGRDTLAPALRARGARILRADVYERVPLAVPPRAITALRALDAPTWLAASSGEALLRTLECLPDDILARLRAGALVAASARLAALARTQGFGRVVVAGDARPRSLAEAAAAAQAGLR